MIPIEESLAALSGAIAAKLRLQTIEYWDQLRNDDLIGVPEDLVRETEARVAELLSRVDDVEALYTAARITAEFEIKRQSLS